jgi:WhiB family redox-sensing transcriptional regulator
MSRNEAERGVQPTGDDHTVSGQGCAGPTQCPGTDSHADGPDCHCRSNVHQPPEARRRWDAAPLKPVQLPPPLFTAWEWQLQASCREYPLEVFFPDGQRGVELMQLEGIAKRICATCPVMVQCRDHALRTPEIWGIWGALTSRERADHLQPSSGPAGVRPG